MNAYETMEVNGEAIVIFASEQGETIGHVRDEDGTLRPVLAVEIEDEPIEVCDSAVGDRFTAGETDYVVVRGPSGSPEWVKWVDA